MIPDRLLGTSRNNCNAKGHCMKCGECCSRFLPLFPDEIVELRKLVKDKNLKPQRNGEINIEGDSVEIGYSSCPFLTKDKKCAIYSHRPWICREYKCNRHPSHCFKSLSKMRFVVPPQETDMYVIFAEDKDVWKHGLVAMALGDAVRKR